jgi:hypothetical protein
MSFFDDDAPEPPKLPPPPEPKEMMNVIDRVAGVQAIITKGPNGKDQREIVRLPRTPQEEQFFRRGEELMSKALKNVNQLYQYKPQDVVNFAPLIETFASLNRERQEQLGQIANLGDISQSVENFKQMQRTVLDEEFARIGRATEEDLVHRGRSDSTAAQEFRAALAKNQALAQQYSGVEAQQYGENLAMNRLQRNAVAFGLGEQGRQERLRAAQAEYAAKQQQVQDLEGRRRVAIGENMNMFDMGAGLVGEDRNKAFMNRAADIADRTFQMQNVDQLNRYYADVNRQNINYQNELAAYNAKGSSFGDFLMQGAGAIAGAYMGGNPVAAAGAGGGANFANWLK